MLSMALGRLSLNMIAATHELQLRSASACQSAALQRMPQATGVRHWD